MYQGNFDFGPNSFPIYDPATTAQDGNGNWSRQQNFLAKILVL